MNVALELVLLVSSDSAIRLFGASAVTTRAYSPACETSLNVQISWTVAPAPNSVSRERAPEPGAVVASGRVTTACHSIWVSAGIAAVPWLRNVQETNTSSPTSPPVALNPSTTRSGRGGASATSTMTFNALLVSSDSSIRLSGSIRSWTMFVPTCSADGVHSCVSITLSPAAREASVFSATGPPLRRHAHSGVGSPLAFRTVQANVTGWPAVAALGSAANELRTRSTALNGCTVT